MSSINDEINILEKELIIENVDKRKSKPKLNVARINNSSSEEEYELNPILERGLTRTNTHEIGLGRSFNAANQNLSFNETIYSESLKSMDQNVITFGDFDENSRRMSKRKNSLKNWFFVLYKKIIYFETYN